MNPTPEALIEVTYPYTGYVVQHILAAGLAHPSLRFDPDRMMVRTMRKGSKTVRIYNILHLTHDQLVLLLEYSENTLVLAPKTQLNGLHTLELTVGTRPC